MWSAGPRLDVQDVLRERPWRVRWESCDAEHRVAFSCKRRGCCPSCGAQRLKRVFNIDIETCLACDGAVRIIACIEGPMVIKQIFDHLKHKAETNKPRALPESRVPPAGRQQGLFD